MKRDSTEDRFTSGVRRQAERARGARKGSLWASAGIVGTVGWMVVLPTLIGITLGRYLDTRFSAGIFWTLSLLALGLALGCVAAWRQIEDVIKG